MAQQQPIHLQPVLNLSELGISASSLRFGNVAIEGDRNLVVRDVESNELYIIHLKIKEAAEAAATGGVSCAGPMYTLTKKPTQAEAALMHPTENIVALKAKTDSGGGGGSGHLVQVLNLDTKLRVGTAPMNEPVVFWRWIGNRVLALVTDRSVYHWDLADNNANSEPTKICDREGRLSESVQIINYCVDKDMKWSMLIGISTTDGGKTIDGNMQLYSLELKKHQQLEGHSACFNNIVMDEGVGPQPVIVFTEKKKSSSEFRLHIRDIYTSRDGGSTPFRVAVDINMPPEAPADFPLSVHISQKYGIIYLITKGGYVILFDCLSGTQLFRYRILQDALFLSSDSPQTGGVLTVHKRGLVCLTTINSNTLIPYIQNVLTNVSNNNMIALNICKRYGYNGSEDMLIQSFNQYFASGNYKSAARVCATLKNGHLRTPQIINQFKSVLAQPGQTSAILIYFSTLLEYGSLNAYESLELVKPVVAQGRKDFISEWIKEDKLECTEELGDIIKTIDTQIALDVYKKCNCGQKILQIYTELGKYNELIMYANNNNLSVDWAGLLKHSININSENGVNFAKLLLNNKPVLIDINVIIDIFLQQNKLQEITSLLLDYLKDNNIEQSNLQTRLFEISLNHSPQVAEAIFQMNSFTHYDKNKIAKLCEKVGLFQRALENYSDINDLKRVMIHTGAGAGGGLGGSGGQINQEWMINFFGKMNSDACIELMTDMLRSSPQNLQPVVAISIKFCDKLGTNNIISMFEKFSSYEGIFYFLGSILAFSTDPDVHFKYIEAAAKLNHTQEVERVCRESKHYDPVKVKEFLKQAKLADPRPLIYVCDLHGFVSELAEYLYKNSLLKYIEVYIARVNATNSPIVIGTLIDLDAPEDFIKNLLQAVRGLCPAAALVEEVEKRNRLKLLSQWLEARVSEGNQDAAVHNALAKICIDTNKDPENFLKTNAYYDSAVVGEYCEERDPHLAYVAYKRAWGPCDTKLVELTNKNGLFRLQARYLVERQSSELWSYVLREDNEHRRSVIDQVVSCALPESTSADEVSATVNAFITAQLPHELIELLEKIVLHNSNFSDNKNLQNLLILTAIKSDSSRIMGYINRLQYFDGAAVAKVALEYNLREEAFSIYKKFGLHNEAAETLLAAVENNDDSNGNDGELERAIEYAQRCNTPEVWKRLGRAQLRRGLISDAVDSLIKAQDGEVYRDVVLYANNKNEYECLVSYLLMARKVIVNKDQELDSELLYAYAKTDRLTDMELFLSGTNTANVQLIGDRLFGEELYSAAKLLYQSIPSYSKLASCYVRMSEFTSAVDAARKAKNPRTWKEVAFGALDKNELKLGKTAALNLIVHPDHLDALVNKYVNLCLHEQLIDVLETAIQGERTHVGMYTELGILYAYHRPDQLLDFCRQHASRVNIPKLIRACERCCLWKEAVFLHMNYDEYEQAASCMIHHPSAWTHEQFTQVLQKVSSHDLFYRSITFYIEFHPLLLTSLLKSLEKQLDHSRVVQFIKKKNHLPLIEKYLVEIVNLNISSVNEALIELYIEINDYNNIKNIIYNYDNFDQLAYAQILEKHQDIEMRRLAALLYVKNKKYRCALDLSKRDGQLQDCIEAARDSGNPQLVEELLRYLVSELKDPCSFAACLQACHSLVKPDVALELAWRNKCMDFCMPFLISVLRDLSNRVQQLDKKDQTREKEEQQQKSAPNDYVPDYTMQPTPGMLAGMGGIALMPPSASYMQKQQQPFGSTTSSGMGGMMGVPQL